MYHAVNEIQGAFPAAIIVGPMNGINSGFIGLHATGDIPNIGLIMEKIIIMGINVMHMGFMRCIEMDC